MNAVAKMFYLSTVGFLLIATQSSLGGECENGWTKFKNELCIKAFTNDLLTFSEATAVCSSQGIMASLLMVKDSDLQKMLANYRYPIFENLWLGGKLDSSTSSSSSGQFKWLDGTPLTYTNWAARYPKTGSGRCIHVKPFNSGLAVDAQWEDSTCEQRYFAICQKPLELGLSLEDAWQEIIRIRNELKRTKEELSLTKQQLNSKLDLVNSEIANVDSRVIPMGSIYVEFYDQLGPQHLWPSLTWQDITSTYAGMFFRALGAGSEKWGATQSACAPRITETHTFPSKTAPPTTLAIPADGWSSYGLAGYYYYTNGATEFFDLTKYHTAGCEVRPKNQAIRIWKRVKPCDN